MSARPDADPAPATHVDGAGSRRPRVLPVVAAAVVLAAVVQALLAQTYVVPSDSLAPVADAGDRLLVWKAGASGETGDVVVVDTTDTAAVDRSTPVDDGPVGSALSTVAGWVGVDIGTQSALAVVDAPTPDGLTVSAPDTRQVAQDDVVGRAVWRLWPLDRFGAVGPVDPEIVVAP